jgi:hypothetical protein
MTARPAVAHAVRVRRDRAHPRRYEIVVSGRLSERFASVFGDLALEPSAGETALSGVFADQAQLYGVLDRLRDLNLELVSVNALD